MKRLACFKDISVTPLDGRFDARSPSGKLASDDFRVVLNVDSIDQNKRCRMGGWQKLMSDNPFGFNNHDLHDQLLQCQQYYEGFEYSFDYPGDYLGGVYPFWFPGDDEPDLFIQDPDGGPYQGYANAYYGDYPYTFVFNQTYIFNAYYGLPDYETDSTYQLGYTEQIYGPPIPAYPYGDLIPVYGAGYSTTYEECGEYAYQRPQQCRESITLLKEAVSVGGRRNLIAGTKSRLYVLSQRDGNWRILADGLGGPNQPEDNCGCSKRRFRTAQLGNFVLFTNDFDPVLIWRMDSGPKGCDLWSVEYVAELLAFGITKAKAIAAWEGFVFIGNVQVAGEQQVSRVFWSDLNNPRAWAPGGGSLSGFFDIGLGEAIVEIASIGGQLRIYTKRGDEKAIYNVALVGGDEIFNFREIYRGPDGIEYENSLVNTGRSHLWFSSSGIMVIGEYDRVPHRFEWIYKADGVFYNGLPGTWVEDFDGLDGFGPVNKEACDNVVGGYNSELKQVWFSWPTDDNECANVSLMLNPVYETASLVNHGFSAFAVFRPDYALTLRAFLAEFGGCDPDDFVMPKEGDPSDVDQGYLAAYIVNEAEDPDAPAHAQSICAALANTTLEDLCESCDADSFFVMADASDKTLKEFTPRQYYRERYVDEGVVYECPTTTPGQYVNDGYYSMMQSDAKDEDKKTEKLVNKAVVDFIAEEQTTPSKLYFNLAYGYQPDCLQWDLSAKPQKLECLTGKSDRQHAIARTRASRLPSFKVYRKGVYLAWRFYVKGTGGASCFNGVTWTVRPATGDWD